jgi:hypothetical protein
MFAVHASIILQPWYNQIISLFIKRYGGRGMLKKTKNFLALALSVCMVFSLTACSREDNDEKSDREQEDMEAIDDKDFQDIMEDLDYEVYEGSGGSKIDTNMYAYDEDMDYYVNFDEYGDKDDAIDDFEDRVDEVKDFKEDKEFEGSNKVSGSGNYKKLVIEGEFNEDSNMFDGEIYIVIVRVDNIMITAYSSSTDKVDVKEVNKIIKELGY